MNVWLITAIIVSAMVSGACFAFAYENWRLKRLREGMNIQEQIFVYDLEHPEADPELVVVEETEVYSLIEDYPNCIYFFASVVIV